MNNFKVALLQLVSKKSQDENLIKGIEFCKEAKKLGADFVLFPEMWNIGYQIDLDLDTLKDNAISKNSLFINEFKNLAKELDMAIGITYLEKFEPLPRNTITIIDRFGKEILTYAKVHTCDFGYEKNLTAGNDFFVASLDTKSGPVRIGSMICFDREFPESARILMLKGAEIILVPNACPMEINRLSQLRARSFENMVGIATTNYASGQPCCNGHSSAFDGIAYDENELDQVKSRDFLILEADEKEGIYLANFEMDKIRRYRENEVHGNSYRHPSKYQILISEKIEEPFIREDYRK